MSILVLILIMKVLTPQETEQKLDDAVRAVVSAETHNRTALSDYNRSNVMCCTDVGYLGAVEEFEEVHRGEDLRHDEEHVSVRDWRARRHGSVERLAAREDGHERVRGDDDEQELNGAGDMVIYHAAALYLVQTRVPLAVEALGEGLNHVQPVHEDECADHGQDQAAVGKPSRYRLVFDVSKVLLDVF